MVCNKCNAQVQDGVQYCPNCGNNLAAASVDNTMNAANANTENQPVMPDVNQNSGVSPANNGNQNNGQDKVNVWLVVLSWFIPLAGLIIFFVKKDSSPKTAKASGICALISFLLNLVIVIASFSLIFGVANKAYNDTIDQAGSMIEDIYDEMEDQIEDAEDIIEDAMDEVTSGDSAIGSDTTTTPTAVSADWKQYQIGIAGKTVTLPMSYTDIATATGFALKDTYKNLVLPNNHYALVNLYKNDKLALYIEVFNNSGVEAKYVDCKVTRVSQTKYQISQGAEAIVFPGGIKAGDAVTDVQITTLFGAPNDLKVNGTTKQYTYLSDTTWTTTNNFKIKVVDGIIDEIQLDHRG